MLNIKHKLRIDDNICSDPNLATRFDQEDLAAIGEWVFNGYQLDEQSREPWLRRTENAMDLAMQVVKEKSFPWPGASNVKFPLVTIAALQFHSRAYPAVINGTQVVKYRTVGMDKDGADYRRALRVGKHMSYQLMEEDEGWEEGMDRLLINLPIVGTVFKKTWYNASLQRNSSELVLAKDLVLNYYSKSVEESGRKTHLIPLHRNDIRERCLRGTYIDITEQPWFQAPSTFQQVTSKDKQQDNREGLNKPAQSDESTPFLFGEQHCLMDLDQDGYHEPYIVTFEISTKTVVRIVANWDRPTDVERNARNQIVRINATQYFTKYGFIPSPDGGIYDVGLGLLLGPINSSVDSLINQLIDAGTLATTAGGFLARGAKVRGGKITFAPLEWHRVDVSGDELQKSIYQLPVREPSNVLFQLLGLLIDYSNRIIGTTDIMVGENIGQNTPAETARSLVEQGTKVYTGIFKRVWRCMKGEVKKLYILNAKHLTGENTIGEDGKPVTAQDYLGNPDMIVPSADPSVVSDQVRLQRVMAASQRAAAIPGYNIPEVEKMFLEALGIENISVIYPGPERVPPLPNPKVKIQEMKLEEKKMTIQADIQMFLANLAEDRRLNTAKIVELQAKAVQELAQADGVQAGHRIAAFEAAIGALKQHDQSIKTMMDLVEKGMKDGFQPTGSDTGGVPSVAGTSGDKGNQNVGDKT